MISTPVSSRKRRKKKLYDNFPTPDSLFPTPFL
jgi:hypothetical protein